MKQKEEKEMMNYLEYTILGDHRWDNGYPVEDAGYNVLGLHLLFAC